MAGPRFIWLTVSLLLASGVGCAQAGASQDLSIIVTPQPVAAGSPELIQISGIRAESIDGEWLGRKVEFFRGLGNRGWFALAGVDVEAPSGPSRLLIHAHLDDGEEREITRAIEIHPARYRTTTLSVSPKFVEPGPDEMKVVEADSAIKARVFASSAAEPLWHGSFRSPVNAAATDSFGTRRVFNGKLDSIHKGMDFRARMGTVVRAGNSGTVVLARRLYFEGNCVIIDHGLGLYTLSMHFSRINVHEGEHVATGQRLGLSGATGRVTGPHLHWAVRWQGAYLDPAKLLRMHLDMVR